MDISKFSSFREPGKIESVKQESPEVPPYLRQVPIPHDMRVTDSQENESSFLLLLRSVYLFLTSYLSHLWWIGRIRNRISVVFPLLSQGALEGEGRNSKKGKIGYSKA